MKRDKTYAELKAIWDKKLKDSGFEDIEDSHGRLKQPDTRTISFQNRDTFLDFYLALDTYLETHKDIPPLDRRVLELHSCGIPNVEIAKRVGRGKTQVKVRIRKYRRIILGQDF